MQSPETGAATACAPFVLHSRLLEPGFHFSLKIYHQNEMQGFAAFSVFNLRWGTGIQKR